MQKKLLIIGYGSIGIRHTRILNQRKNFSPYIYSKNTKHSFTKIPRLQEIINIDPYYIIISSSTYNHLKDIRYIDNFFKNKKCLIEKPLFSIFNKHYPNFVNNDYYVGFLLRFHPFYKILKDIFSKEKSLIYHLEFKSSSYLPNWRKNIQYQNSSSASKLSGGVIHDYSHEIDFITSIFGFFKINFVNHLKLSNLKIQSKDYLFINGKKNKINFDLNFDYYSKEPIRSLKIFTQKTIYIFDFLSSELKIQKINKIIKKKYYIKPDEMYLKQHLDILSNKVKIACSYKEALKLNKFLVKINNYGKTKN